MNQSEPASPYAAFPGHPLGSVPQSTLDVARAALAELVVYKEIDPDMADPIADTVVAALAVAGLLQASPPASVNSVSAALRKFPALHVQADLSTDTATGETSGTVTVPADTSDTVVDQLRADLGPHVEVARLPLPSRSKTFAADIGRRFDAFLDSASRRR